MPAINTDLLKKLSRKWVSQIGSGGVDDAVVTTIPLSSVTNLPTDTAVVATIDRVDANGVKTPTLEESIIGVVSGTNLATCVRGAEGTAQAHAAGAVVEILVTAKGINDIVDWGLVEHSQLGVHSSALVTSLKASGAVVNTGTSDVTIVTPKAIADSKVSITDKAETLTLKTLTSPKINEDVALTSTATELNLLHSKLGAWTAFTPAWSNLTEGSGTNVGYYCQIGKFIHFKASITFAADTSITGTGVVLTLPVSAASTAPCYIGLAYLFDSGVDAWTGTISTTGTVGISTVAGTRIISNSITATAPFTWTTNDIISVTGTYEAA